MLRAGSSARQPLFRTAYAGPAAKDKGLGLALTSSLSCVDVHGRVRRAWLDGMQA